jgi:PTH1 family peptidyl-tRNA hydrolase
VALKLVVGLGNPGSRYEQTRHNIGFRLVDRLVGEADLSWKDFKALGVAAKWNGIWVAKPTTFMNDSGQFVRGFMDYHNIGVKEVLIVYDELALKLGTVRLRLKGSAGGQKGMLSIIQHVGTEEVSRLRLGIGPQPERMDSADFVLGRFRAEEENDLEAGLERGVQAVRCSLEDGFETAMNQFNPA